MNVNPNGPLANVTGAIRRAAQMTGADFQYLLATAQVESNLDPKARGATSSARGLFQFIEQTWLATLKEEGPGLGYGPYADAIVRRPTGEYALIDPRHHKAVMDLRSDPAANAAMAGAFTRANASKLAASLGRRPTDGELYIAHFLGAVGAGKLIELAAAVPQARAADTFPGAARANPTIFYDRDRRVRGAGEVYGLLVNRYQAARAGTQSAPNAVAVAVRDAKAIPSDPAQVAAAYAAVQPPAAPADAGPVFHGLFRSNGAQEPVAPVVSALWGSRKPQPLSEGATAAPQPAPPPVGGAHDLFQDRLPDARALFRGRV
ncbi:MAG: lytic transglycosylase domain-containing protein [Alphaproteobacteria bacterium]|nr:lytic transglycosylase domain-containing protein [Alphaproteobacteria bacterium]